MDRVNIDFRGLLLLLFFEKLKIECDYLRDLLLIFAIIGFENEKVEESSYYMNQRWYDSDTGNFISEDPAKSGVNYYGYCGGNPVNFVDPLGLKGGYFGTRSSEDAASGTWRNSDGTVYYQEPGRGGSGGNADTYGYYNDARWGNTSQFGKLFALESYYASGRDNELSRGISRVLNSPFTISVGDIILDNLVKSGGEDDYTLTLYIDQPGEGGDRDKFELYKYDSESNKIFLENNSPEYYKAFNSLISTILRNEDNEIYGYDVGHTFIGLRNSNGEEIAFGFYPHFNVSAITPSGQGVIYNDTKHILSGAWDVKYSINISKSQYSQILGSIDYQKYNVYTTYNSNSFNCTTWAMNIMQNAGANFPKNIGQGFWFGGGYGLNPADLGQDLMRFGGIKR